MVSGGCGELAYIIPARHPSLSVHWEAEDRK